MTVASDNKFPKIVITESAAPSSPAAGDQKLFIDSSDKHLKLKNSAGAVTDLQAAARVPQVIQMKTAGVSAASVTLDAAPASGHTVLLFTDSTSTGLITSVSSTNTTWTRMASRSSGGFFYEIWVGVVAGGAGGTVISITSGNAYCTLIVAEISDTLTATAGVSANAANAVLGSLVLAASTAGNLIAAMAAPEATSGGNYCVVRLSGILGVELPVSAGFVGFSLGYSAGAAVTVHTSGAAGGTVVAEIS